MSGRRDSADRAEDEPPPVVEASALALTFRRIYDERFDDVERWVRAFGGRAPDIPDLVHDIFVVAYRRLAHFDEQNVAGWLYRITRRKMRDYRHLSWIKHLFTERTLSTFEHSLAVGADPLHQLESHRETQLLQRILDTLPAEQRAAFVLFEIEGYSGAEIAQLEGVPLNTVWGRIYKAKQKLQSRLRPSRGVPSLKR